MLSVVVGFELLSHNYCGHNGKLFTDFLVFKETLDNNVYN